MRPLVALAVLAVLGVLAALPLAQSKGHGIGEHANAKDANATAAANAWPCCDKCDSCTRSIPPQCRCADTAPSGCNPGCKNCAKTSHGGSDVFQCMDRVANLCKRRCTPAA